MIGFLFPQDGDDGLTGTLFDVGQGRVLDDLSGCVSRRIREARVGLHARFCRSGAS